MKYLFVTQHNKSWPIELMCRVLGVSRQGYYHYRQVTAAKQDHPVYREMLEWLEDVAIASHYSMVGDGWKRGSVRNSVVRHEVAFMIVSSD